MPKVPTLQPQALPQPGSAPRVNTNLPAEAFGGGQAAQQSFAAVQKTLKVASDIFDREKIKADDAVVLGAKNAYGKFVDNFLWDPEEGAMRKKGQDSFGLVDQAKEANKAALEDIGKTLINDEQKAKFAPYQVQTERSTIGSIQKHVGAQTDAVYLSEHKAHIVNETNSAQLNYENEDRVKLAVENIKASSFDIADKEGIGPKGTKAFVLGNISSMHLKVIDQILKEDKPREAEKYFDKNKDQIVGKDLSNVQSDIEKEILNETIMVEAAAVIDDRRRYGDKAAFDRLDAIREKNGPEVGKAVTKIVKDSFELDSYGRKTKAKIISHKVAQEIDKGVPLREAMKGLSKEERDLLSPSDKKSMRLYEVNYKKGNIPDDNWEIHRDVMGMATGTAAERKEFVDEGYVKYINKVSPKQFTEIKNEWLKLKRDANKPAKAKKAFDQTDMNKVYKTTLDLVLPMNTAADRMQNGRMVQEFLAAVDMEINIAGREDMNTEKFKKIVNGLLLHGETNIKGAIFDRDRYLFEFKEGDKFDVEDFDIDKEIPLAHQIRLRKTLKQQGVPLTDENIAGAWISERSEAIRGR